MTEQEKDQAILSLTNTVIFLKEIIRDTPIMTIDTVKARELDDKEALKYHDLVSKWVIRAAKAAI